MNIDIDNLVSILIQKTNEKKLFWIKDFFFVDARIDAVNYSFESNHFYETRFKGNIIRLLQPLSFEYYGDNLTMQFNFKEILLNKGQAKKLVQCISDSMNSLEESIEELSEL
jgi:hypothetical protein